MLPAMVAISSRFSAKARSNAGLKCSAVEADREEDHEYDRCRPWLTGAARFLIEFIRLNARVALGMTVAQLASLGLVAVGVALGTPGGSGVSVGVAVAVGVGV